MNYTILFRVVIIVSIILHGFSYFSDRLTFRNPPLFLGTSVISSLIMIIIPYFVRSYLLDVKSSDFMHMLLALIFVIIMFYNDQWCKESESESESKSPTEDCKSDYIQTILKWSLFVLHVVSLIFILFFSFSSKESRKKWIDTLKLILAFFMGLISSESDQMAISAVTQ